MPPRRRTPPAPLLTDTDPPTPPSVAAIEKVADREERKTLLSGLMRDPVATGAEKVAAARLLEAMERTDTNSATQGIPPPTSRPEQVMRCVRILTAFGATITLEALEILAQRYERAQKVSMQNRKDGKLFNIGDLPKYRKRLRPRGGPKNGSDNREGQRPEHGAGGTAAAEPSGLPELHEAPEPVGSSAHADEQHGNGVGESVVQDGDRTECHS